MEDGENPNYIREVFSCLSFRISKKMIGIPESPTQWGNIKTTVQGQLRSGTINALKRRYITDE